MVFQSEILEIANHSLLYSKAEGKAPMTCEEIIRITENNSHLKVNSIIIPTEEGKNYQLMVEETHADDHKGEEDHHHGKSIVVNPYTGQIVDQKSTAQSFFGSVLQLHRWLLTDSKVGRPITGAATVIFLIIAISGIILYFPARIKLWFKRRLLLPSLDFRNIPNKAYPLHFRLGYYALIPLLMMGFSGLIWSYPSYYKELENLLGDKLGKQRFDKPIDIPNLPDSLPAYKVPVASLLAKVDSALAYPAKIYRVDFSENPAQTILIRKKSSAFMAYDASDKVQLNPYTGKIIEVDRFKDWKTNSKIAALIRTLHVGSIFGFASKIIYFLAALIATSLPITGLTIWIRKLKQQKIRNRFLD